MNNAKSSENLNESLLTSVIQTTKDVNIEVAKNGEKIDQHGKTIERVETTLTRLDGHLSKVHTSLEMLGLKLETLNGTLERLFDSEENARLQKLKEKAIFHKTLGKFGPIVLEWWKPVITWVVTILLIYLSQRLGVDPEVIPKIGG